MDIKLILLNNSGLGKISKEQRSGGFDEFAADLHNPDFTGFAKGCGALGLGVEHKTELEEKMQRIIMHKGTALLEIKTDVNLV